MSDAHWERVKEILEAAAKLSGAEREACLREGCGGDGELRAEVESLLRNHDRAGDFLAAPAIDLSPLDEEPPDPPWAAAFSPGEIISGRFEIVRFLGRGGMGEVYEARDSELGERIALKTIRAQISSEPRTLARFKQEIQLARRVTHPNVCRIFDIEWHRGAPGADGVSRDITFLTMELLTGETLAEAIRRCGKFSPEEALPLIRQMAAALGAAHNAGVIHRDFKPSNVMLVAGSAHTPVPGASGTISEDLSLENYGPGRRAVVTDFGLARLSRTQGTDATTRASTLTGAHQVLGTLAYMAPEQIEGGAVTAATDIYALGLVVYEMLTGVLPYVEGSSSFGVFRRMKEPAPAPMAAIPSLDPAWDRAIRRSLEHQAGARFSTAHEFLSALTGGSRGRAARRLSHPRFPSGGWHLKARSFAGILLAAMVLVALFTFGLRHYYGSPTENGRGTGLTPSGPELPNGGYLLFTDIRNNTSDARLGAVSELLRAQLAQSKYFTLLPPARVSETLERMGRGEPEISQPMAALENNDELAREVALRSGSGDVVFGAVSRIGSGIHLDLQVERPDTTPHRPRHMWSKEWTITEFNADSPGETLSALRSASEWIRQSIGESPDEIRAADLPPQDVTTSNWQALMDYAAAERVAGTNDRASAIAYLRKALAEDPQFALARLRLCDILVSLRNYAEGFACYQEATDSTKTRALAGREEYRIAGLLAMDTWDYERGRQSFKTYSDLYPNDYLGWFYQAYPLMLLGNLNGAIGVLETAHERLPSAYHAPAHLARFQMIAGNLPEAYRWIGTVRYLGRSEDADYLKANRYVLAAIEALRRGDTTAADADFAQAEHLYAGLADAKSPDYRADRALLLATLAAERGQEQKAISMLSDALEKESFTDAPSRQVDDLLSRASLFLGRSDADAVLADCKAALHLDAGLPRLLQAGTLIARAMPMAGPAQRPAYQSQLDALRRAIAKEPAQFVITQVVRARVEGEILFAQGRTAEALREFQRADQLEPPFADREYYARALAAAGRTSEAFEKYSITALHPGLFWQEPDDGPPTLWSDALGAWVALGARLRSTLSAHQLEAVKSSLQLCLRLRGTGSEVPTELHEAEKLLQIAWKTPESDLARRAGLRASIAPLSRADEATRQFPGEAGNMQFNPTSKRR